MTANEAIYIYKKNHTLPSVCHLNWLKDNFNPILKGLDERIIINWSCSTCIRNYMNMLVGWIDREDQKKEMKTILKKAKKVIKKPKSATKKRKKSTKKQS